MNSNEHDVVAGDVESTQRGAFMSLLFELCVGLNINAGSDLRS